MNKKVDFPQSAIPLNDELLAQVSQFESKALYWLSGYCSGLADAKAVLPKSAEQDLVAAAPYQTDLVELQVLVLYASQSGNAKKLAESLHQNLSQKGRTTALASVADFKPAKLAEQQVILLVAATHGEGEPPDDAIDFLEFLRSNRAPKLKGVQHAVLSLGDSSYEFFCQTGKDFDAALSQLGSTAFVERVDCDIDYEVPAAGWIAQVVGKIDDISERNKPQILTSVEVADSPSTNATYNKENPFAATVLEVQKITGQGSDKEIVHIELSLEDSGISFQAGDSLGVWAKNNDAVVGEILNSLQLSGTETVTLNGQAQSLKQALTDKLEITLLNKNLLSELAELAQSDELKKASGENFAEFIQNHQLVDALNIGRCNLKAQQLVDLLKPLKPRLYSIASSLQANPQEVHLTVALKRAHNDQGERFGAASFFLIESLQEGDKVAVYVEPNPHFKLPEHDRPVIMIGPGTGIAPFRAFLQEREENNAKGDNWLFFGNPNFNTDFLYQLELQAWLKSKLLTRLSLAFSRDQAEKIYVQHRLLEHAADIWHWLKERQAALYVCGDMSRMAKDVESTLLKIIEEQGGMDEQAAKEFLRSLKQEKRYQRDVY